MFREVIVDHIGKTMAKIGENEGGLGESDIIIFGMLKLTRFLLVVLHSFTMFPTQSFNGSYTTSNSVTDINWNDFKPLILIFVTNMS